MRKCLRVLNLLVEKKVAAVGGDRLKVSEYEGMIKRHIADCSDCRTFLEEMRQKTKEEEVRPMDIQIGKRLRELRKSLGLTQKQFARRVPGKVDYTYISKIERSCQYPSLKFLERIGKAYNVSLDFFFRGKNERAKIKRLEEELKKLKAEMPEPR